MIATGTEEATRAAIRHLMFMCLTPAFLTLPGRARLPKDFWRVGQGWGITPKKRNRLPFGPGNWHDFTAEFVEWLVYEKRLGPQIVSLVDRWQTVLLSVPVDIARNPVSCTVKKPQQQKYGFDGVPGAVVYGARWRELAHRFSLEHLSHQRTLPIAPRPTDATVDYLVFCVMGSRYDPTLTEDAAPYRLGQCVEILGEHDPDIVDTESNAHHLHEVARFLAATESRQPKT